MMIKHYNNNETKTIKLSNPLDKIAIQIDKKIMEEKRLSHKHICGGDYKGDSECELESNSSPFINDVIDRPDRESFETYYEATKSEFCQNMSFERIHNRVFLSDLSKQSGILVATLEAYELGESNFDFEHICRIAYSLNVTLGAIFGGS